MSVMTISEKCAHFIKNIEYDCLSSDIIRLAKMCFLDFIGCTIAGSITTEGHIITDFVCEQAQSGEATILGKWSKTSHLYSALANGFNCHIHECDDVHKKSVLHPGAPVIAAALAMSEATHKSGKEFLEAIVAGYDIMIRAGEAVMPSHYYFWHTTATCGNFGAAAAAGKLLGLSTAQMTNALGNAGSQAAGLWEFLDNSSMTKYLHCGKAAYNGMLAALLAKKGFTGPTKIFEGDRGFVKATSQEMDPDEKFLSLGQQFKITETVFKPYPSCRHTHSSIGAIISLKEQYHIVPSNVAEMVLYVNRVATQIAQNNEKFDEPRAAKFSLVYCAASALYYGSLPLKAFTLEALANPDVLQIADNTVVNIDDECDRAYPEKWMSRVKIKTKDGKIYEKKVEYPKGDPENPFSDKDFEDKFLGLVATAIDDKQARRLLESCMEIEDYKDISDVFKDV